MVGLGSPCLLKGRLSSFPTSFLTQLCRQQYIFFTVCSDASCMFYFNRIENFVIQISSYRCAEAVTEGDLSPTLSKSTHHARGIIDNELYGFSQSASLGYFITYTWGTKEVILVFLHLN